MPRQLTPQEPLTDTEQEDIITAVQSVFRKVKKLHRKVVPIYEEYGFRPPSAGVIARDISERIETAIAQHSEYFDKKSGHTDLWRGEYQWEVKICKGSGLTINQSKVLNGESYIVVNYRADNTVSRIWVLWRAADKHFSARRPNSNARTVAMAAATQDIEVLYEEQPRATVVAGRKGGGSG